MPPPPGTPPPPPTTRRTATDSPPNRYDGSQMSLRAFHILFISVSVLLCLYMAGWAVLRLRAGDAGGRIWGAIAVAALAGLIVYLTRYVRSGRRAA